MRGQILKPLLSLMITVLLLASLLTTFIWYTLENNNVQPKRLLPQKKTAPPTSKSSCKDCREKINKVLEQYSEDWKKQDEYFQKFRSQLSTKCHGLEKATITQANTPVGTKLVYDGEKKRTLQVNPEIFSTFFKGHPFPNKTWHTCAVVGNGGILVNSSCGKMIDSAEFVIRCNLPPLSDGYEKHVGIKTDLVTANPSILLEKFGALMGRRRKFVESMTSYGNSLLLLPAFSYGRNTPVSLRAFYTLEDFESPVQPIFFNPGYLHNLALFWRSQGLRTIRLSTGIIMTSLALELCDNVQLYGFWPFDFHPYSFQTLTNHYYDDRKTKTKFHAMPDEFSHLLRLHSQGILKLHLGDCKAEPN
ncbi:alpha-2,8-sialyltransferase 8F-like [Poecilia latipinna]|uniref:alpha-2,8-sialyltransferase 8F-like n=1 Tax=Poecilia latipinna TaxID=48699 RepID=UPI00072E21BD|nr:PREDICTED: alpha-2,8-sialyltransferase 8F-like [Poecilia latipinna]